MRIPANLPRASKINDNNGRQEKEEKKRKEKRKKQKKTRKAKAFIRFNNAASLKVRARVEHAPLRNRARARCSPRIARAYFSPSSLLRNCIKRHGRERRREEEEAQGGVKFA